MRSDAVGRAVDWRRRDALLLEHDAELDVRSVGEDSGSRDRARVVCEVRRVVDATVFGAVAAVLLIDKKSLDFARLTSLGQRR